MTTSTLRRAGTVVPVLILMALAATGIAGAFQADDEEAVDYGPQIADFTGEDGAADVAGYLIADAAFASAPAVLVDAPIEFRVFGCVEGEPVTIELIPRVLNEDEAAAQEGLEDDAKLLEEPEVLVDEAAALADGSVYEITIPVTTPQGFTRLRVTCTGAEGPLVTDTVLNLLLEEPAEPAEGEDPIEVVTTVDGGDTPTALAVTAAAPAAEN